MRITIGADHRGFALKQQLVTWLRGQGHEVTDVGTTSDQSTDYPIFAAQVARHVAHGQADRGILVCATGVGMCITANKVHGVRATIADDEDVARLSRQHNNVNVLCMGEKLDPPAAEKIVGTWLTTEFEGGGRHTRRLGEIAEVEKAECKTGK
jgi:ribose 5-phosphate isomerase B